MNCKAATSNLHLYLLLKLLANEYEAVLVVVHVANFTFSYESIHVEL